ncbi:ABC transporter substrate-binding protein [Bradyrhizobium sp. SSUT112]|uniref:ABC transporter substrate-binding protein n=1 Tax=Bradyrhizobium sp. SSUT112 TaxID=3040604 RepID=UPI00244B3386|nr:ABC transporter substrate-binding protein [Bradyrhizobium sp. SSUT112]MDH2356506.1 ABC transporter substrate-binding protein [Bradyrhizobium sp. SSUT112]
MTEQDSGRLSLCGLSRRSLLKSTVALLSVPFVAEATCAWAREKLAGTGEVVVFSWGGSFTDGVRRYVYEPFTKATGIKVADVVADLAEPQVKAMHEVGRVDWDIAYVAPMNYPEMHERGMFVPIDYSFWDQESLEGTPPHTRLEDAIVIDQSAYVLAYDERAFPKSGPQNWADFWDVKKFPGPRGLFASAGKCNIQFALLAAGVAHKDIWPLTDDKVDRAFAKLNEIRPHITKWWSAGGEVPQLLINREYATSSIYDGRAVAAIHQGAPIKIVWEGAYIGPDYAAILKGGPNTANAQKLIAFLNRAQIAAGWTQGTGYPGPNTHQLKYLPADLISQVSVNPENASKCILEDSAWLVAKRPDSKTNADHIQERWLAWRAG